MLNHASMEDLDRLCDFYRQVCQAMNSEGLNQWEWGRYPTKARLQEDLLHDRMYIYEESGQIVAAVVLEDVLEEEYLPLNWMFGTHPGVFHRYAVLPQCQGKGFGKKLFGEMDQILRDMGCDCVRFDTEHDNHRAIALYDKIAERRVGIIHWDGDDTDYVAFEKRLTSSCPLLPVRMKPAFRTGKLTPWGGERLKTIYGKDIPEVPAGESLEVSCIPGLESTDCCGMPLTEMIKRFGSDLVGRYADGQFPLLLKLIDARDSLSVQVHPGDEYAFANENGKLGKTEAWLILDAPKGSQLVYGIKPGTTMQQLQIASNEGAAVKDLLRMVEVQPGDICYIPSGCVHAIGKGIMLYEIQQSSDITYRFYDWDRVDKDGCKRQLHIKKALDVTDIFFSPQPRHYCGENHIRMLDEKYFTLDMFNVNGSCDIGEIENFGLLTALTGTLSLSWNNAAMEIKCGETVLIPAKSVKLKLIGSGTAALSMPR